MKYLDAIKLLKEFDNQNRALWLHEGVIGTEIRITDDSKSFKVVVTIESSIEKSNINHEAYGLPSDFIYDGVSYVVELESSDFPRAQIEVGSPAYGDGLNGVGTYGWGFYLDGIPTALSNWHVFCADGNSTPLGISCFLDDIEAAVLSSFESMKISGNLWDLAIARFRDSGQLEALMRDCQQPPRKPYPMKMEWNPSLGQEYYKVGRTAPTCRIGKLRGIGSSSVRYNDGVIRSFRDQLIFTKMTDAGDSGAIIVNSHSNEIAGLNFAGGNDRTIANPLFLKGWKYRGTLALEDGFEVPMYETSENNDIALTHETNSEIEFESSGISEAPPSIGGVHRKFEPLSMNLFRQGYSIGTNRTTRLDIKIIGKHGDWLHLSAGSLRTGWYHPASDFVLMD